MLGAAQTAWDANAWNRDPYWNNVVMLINAYNGTVADRSNVKAGITIVQSPGGVASTTQKLYRPYSIYNASATRYRVNASADRQCPGEFTFEYWSWSSTTASTYNCPHNPGSTTSNAGWMNASVGTSKSGRLSWEFTQSYVNYYVSATSIHNSTWHHIAVTRQSDNVIRFYYDGVQAAATRTSNATMDFGTYGWLIAGYTNGAGDNIWIGYMDDIRLTKGVARYTGNFTPPTTAFPMY